MDYSVRAFQSQAGDTKKTMEDLLALRLPLLTAKEMSAAGNVGGNVGESGKKITLPHYMAMFLTPAHM